jgi:hypothetical protein
LVAGQTPYAANEGRTVKLASARQPLFNVSDKKGVGEGEREKRRGEVKTEDLL